MTPINYNLEKKLKSLSQRLKYLGKDSDIYHTYVNQRVKVENLRYNLSLVLSQIILKLSFPDWTIETFNKALKEYNIKNNATLDYATVYASNWIRIISNEVVIPRRVSHFIWEVEYYRESATPKIVPETTKELFNFLKYYNNNYYKVDAKLWISKADLESLLSVHSSINVQFLLDRDILKYNSETESYSWLGGDFQRNLRREITATLWIMIGALDATELDFIRYSRLIKMTGLGVDDLSDFLDNPNRVKMRDLALTVLRSEQDVVNSTNEFKKIWLDAEAFRDISVNDTIPQVNIDNENTDVFIEEMRVCTRIYQGLWDYQGSRRLLSIYLEILAYSEPNHAPTYEAVLSILKDVSRPYLVWELYNLIPKRLCHIIPYLLIDEELVPTAFKMLDKVVIDPLILAEQSRNELQWEESLRITDELWLEMYNLVLDTASKNVFYDSAKGAVIGKMFNYVTEKVFTIETNINSVTSHKIYNARYDEMLKRLTIRRFDQANENTTLPPRIMFYVLPDAVDYIISEHLKHRPSYFEFLSLKSSFIDLAIKFLRCLCLSTYSSEITKDQLIRVAQAKLKLINTMVDYLKWYYSVEEFEVLDDNAGQRKKKTARRGVNEFGFEIIDWGYLFLHLQADNLLDDLDKKMQSSLVFVVEEDKYNDQNREQAEKMRIYLKSLNLAYLSISKNKENFICEGFDAVKTLNKLQNLIIVHSVEFRKNDLNNKRIDVFDERFHYFASSLYNRSLISLLYEAANHFDKNAKEKFVSTFFDGVDDIARLLEAVNVFESVDLINTVSEKINALKVEDFIDSAFSTTELQTALIQATNSERHWVLAEPLLRRLQVHFSKIDHYHEDVRLMLFEIDLILAFKKKDFGALEDIKIPDSKNSHLISDRDIYENLQSYYYALFEIFNVHNYDKGNVILEGLLSRDPKNIKYAFNLYRSRLLKGLKEQ